MIEQAKSFLLRHMTALLKSYYVITKKIRPKSKIYDQKNFFSNSRIRFENTFARPTNSNNHFLDISPFSENLIFGTVIPNYHDWIVKFSPLVWDVVVCKIWPRSWVRWDQTYWINIQSNFRGLPTYGIAHAKVKKTIFYSEILEFIPNIGIIFNDFQSWFYSIIKNWLKFTWLENLKIPGIQPRFNGL